MAYDFKKLADVEALNEVPEGATVLAEVGGQVKRIPGEGLGGGGFVAVFTVNAETGEISCDKTFEECVEANNQGIITGVVYLPEDVSYNTHTKGYACSFGVMYVYDWYDEAEHPLSLEFAFAQGNIHFNADGTIEM